jgi:hypothetical protein
MNTQSELDTVIRYLERVAGCPDDYIKPDAPPAISFMTGFYTALIAADWMPLAEYADCARQVIEEAGWLDDTRPLWQQMRERGLTDEAITSETIHLRLEAWKRLRDSLNL